MKKYVSTTKENRMGGKRNRDNIKLGLSGVRDIHWRSLSKEWIVKVDRKYRGAFKDLEDAKRKVEHIKLLESYKNN